MSVGGGVICCPSSPHRLSYASRSSPTIKQRSSSAVFLQSSASKGLHVVPVPELQTMSLLNLKTQCPDAERSRKLQLEVMAMAASYIGLPHSWWKKGRQPNMKEIHSAREFMDSLTNAGHRLVVVEFYSPYCRACRALHPQVCQMAASNPDVEFLLVNFEENRSMCYAFHIKVLPYFQLYRGAQGLLCAFTCTAATIKIFKDALAKHNREG